MPLRRSFWILATVAFILGGTLLAQYYQRIASDPALPSTVRTLSESTTSHNSAPSASSQSGISWTTTPFERAFVGVSPPPPLLTGILTTAAAGYDRITFNFTGSKPPGYRAAYINQAVNEDSGQPVILNGPVVLQLTFSPASTTGPDGKATMVIPPGLVMLNLSALKSYLLNGNFENHISFAVGLSGQSGFHITETNPTPNTWTIEVDLRH